MASYWQIFISFFKIGSFTLGGGYAMIPLIQQEVVDKKGWLKESEFVEMMAIAQSAPGPIALNTAIFVGYKARGIKGVIFSSLGTILPSFIVILLIAIIFTDFKNNPGVERVFKGIRPAVVASLPPLYTKWANQQESPAKPSSSRLLPPCSSGYSTSPPFTSSSPPSSVAFYTAKSPTNSK